MNIAIIGATGYGGVELIRMLAQHRGVKQIDVYSSSKHNTMLSDMYPHMKDLYNEILQPLEAADWSAYEVVFLSTPPGISADWSETIAKHTKVIDLSGDLRLKNSATYEDWYQRESAPETLLKEAVYGLTEWNRNEVAGTSLLSNPGCYPTAVLLGLLPLAGKAAIDPSNIIIDAKTGTTGAGRTPSAVTHFSEMDGNFKIYKVNEHKHTPEIEQALDMRTGENHPVTFSPHLVPMTRGILATMYVPLTSGTKSGHIEELFHQAYDKEPFVRVRREKAFPATKEVYGSNFCDIGWTVDERTSRLTVVSVIDNLVKGASGQAIQNMNVMLGADEKEGISQLPVYP
ncbi:N-acetyl-gamma-glutamyl-phosphate reductase [Marinococcus halophilus]|uniref:N-acetyl-gamma-glutamyl-phosphate reductase n=1 Tax=Marinococcus halophilus TaxID=1371 RepID=A0A510Y3U1_MARHA|nr:N-acetyl-gamma-glutamyl-phosphate reductase [Marinococcus halophilus]OZT80076.1 N-acetyl-gamma-glutamyl-phosphate reductase [Marinococcus halophilus]GEK58000.1 N-acetyl-gamma-glutamyl-phosphate reductase [Marinococcus halophilus]